MSFLYQKGSDIKSMKKQREFCDPVPIICIHLYPPHIVQLLFHTCLSLFNLQLKYVGFSSFFYFMRATVSCKIYINGHAFLLLSCLIQFNSQAQLKKPKRVEVKIYFLLHLHFTAFDIDVK